MLYTSATLAVLGLATLAQSHMIMNTPVPFGKSTLNNSPLLADGSDFPCKQRTGVYTTEGASNSMALGSVQPLSFTGSATHGGGSCQISITYDQAPTTSSTWKVIHSIEGGCPIQNVAGNNGDNANAVDPSTYSFTIPTTLPTGTAVLAWTWFNKIGNREMYMNCAPITITAGSTKRSVEDEDLMRRNYTQFVERDTAAFNALPNMFIANIPSSSCETVDSQDLAFPNPGDSLEKLGTATATPVAPKGTACGSVVVATVAASAGSGTGASAVTSVAASKATSAKASTSAGQGGVFVTVATSAAASKATVATSVAVGKATSTPVASVVKTSSAIASKATPVASSAAPASSGTTGTGSAIVAGTACTTEGMWNCIGGTSFQQCASGTWSAVQSVAAGTTCTSGQSMSMSISAVASKEKMKRGVRFSKAHIRRHLLS
jgi:hypothetical protein